MQKIQCALLGDANVGKTSLMVSYLTNVFPGPQFMHLSDNYTAPAIVDGCTYSLTLWDTSRPLPNAEADVFVVCFSLIDDASFENVRRHWVPQVRHQQPAVPLVLVGTKADLRHTSAGMGEAMAVELGAVKYVECSALTPTNRRSEVFAEAIRCVVDQRTCIRSELAALFGEPLE